jgi:hypothetical protein
MSLVRIISHKDPLHTFPYNFLKIYFNIIFLSTAVLQVVLFPLGFPTKPLNTF